MRLFLLPALLLIAAGSPGLTAQTAQPGAAEARLALEAFIGAWNTADNAALRRTMNFPFISLND